MNQYVVIMPELVTLLLGLFSFICGVLKRQSRVGYFLGILSFVTGAFILFFLFSQTRSFFELISIDPISSLFRMLIFIVGIVVLVLSYNDNIIKTGRQAEYVFLVILAVFGMNMMVISNDLLVLYLALETFSLSSYVLAGFYRDDKKSVEAAMKYFMLGTISSIFLLASIAFFYAISGTTSIDAFKTLDGNDVKWILSVLFLLSAFAFKLALVPFHAWAPDVYQGSPTPITAFFSTAPKLAVFAALLRMFLKGIEQLDVTGFVVIVSAMSIMLGNFLAMRQTDLKRMFAYSSIAHAGYIFMAFVLIDQSLLNSVIPYLVVYLFMNIGAFAVIMSVKGGESIVSYYGIGRKSPLIAFSMTVILLSLTGIPPTGGFIVKFNIFKNVFAAGYGGLVFLGLLMSILSAFYYLRIVFYMYKDGLSEIQEYSSANHYIGFISAAFLLIAGIFPEILIPL
ncbi:NADH-quinone oxidoreductase subunit N [Thermodesulfovibrio thiophilus]|uniref:NADH-quinone oxidoreductase subunit N n=1 Tax=Thermodesulfovibrio thiophilus TaxID=340095 RepID=UPI00042024FF|nr:NADH-quinone oxidoreductase subunit N [Thermodesulfovibrio thiophilus]HOA82376.1 NADH-quinone oxidoreductase subunit N [Thermodesulfovibrio thiophilus]